MPNMELVEQIQERCRDLVAHIQDQTEGKMQEEMVLCGLVAALAAMVAVFPPWCVVAVLTVLPCLVPPRFPCSTCSQRQLLEGSFKGDCGCHVCQDCLKRHVRRKVESEQVADEQLCCPGSSCQQRLTEGQVLTVLAPDDDLRTRFLNLRYFTCGVCCAKRSTKELFSSGCKHQVCSTCMTKHLNDKVESSMVSSFTCPCAGCMQPVTDHEIRSLDGGSVLMEIIELLRGEDDRVRKFTCPVCMEKKAKDGSFTPGCGHWFCFECIAGHMQSKINDNEVAENQLCCPQCPEALSVQQVIGALEFSDDKDEWVRKFLHRRLEKKVAEEGSDYCRCPTEHCDYFFIRRPGDDPDFKCEKCQNEFCLACSAVGDHKPVGPGHRSRSCQEQKEKLEHDAEERQKFEEWKAQNDRADELFNEYMQQAGTKACPRCGCKVEKTQGCDHMDCAKCKCKFCWVCLRYNSGNEYTCGYTCGYRG